MFVADSEYFRSSDDSEGKITGYGLENQKSTHGINFSCRVYTGSQPHWIWIIWESEAPFSEIEQPELEYDHSFHVVPRLIIMHGVLPSFSVTSLMTRFLKLKGRCTSFLFLWRYSPNLGLGLPPWNSPFHFGLYLLPVLNILGSQIEYTVVFKVHDIDWTLVLSPCLITKAYMMDNCMASSLYWLSLNLKQKCNQDHSSFGETVVLD
jgi:hypothetical protein